MYYQKPARDPDLTIKNVHIGEDCICYSLYYEKSGRVVDWVIPANSTFDPPEDLLDCEWAVWTEDISQTRKKDYDWVYMQKMSEYLNEAKAPTSALGKKIKMKKANAQLNEIQTAMDTFRRLFEGLE
jgi:hypothetical protein